MARLTIDDATPYGTPMSLETSERYQIGLNLDSLRPLHWFAILLAAFTGTVHLSLYVDQGYLPFLLAGVGFYAAIAALLVTGGWLRMALYLLGIPYVVAQIVGYYVIEQPDSVADMSSIAIADKIVQVTLIVVLAVLFYSEWTRR